MDLFEYNMSQQFNTKAPLAARMRPESLEDYVGQEHIIGKGKMLYNVIKAVRLGSIILYGPPGTGKTTLAKALDSLSANLAKYGNVQAEATPRLMAGALLYILPLLIMYMVLQRYFVQSVERTGIVG